MIPQFCVNLPVGGSVRRETTVPLLTVLTRRADLRVESGISATDVIRLTTSLDSAIGRVEQALDHRFTSKPRIFVFATRASFARGTQDLFGYSLETAANTALAYGAVFDPGTLTIAVSWQAATSSTMPELLAHELTHLAMREVVGRNAVLPVWFEEGLAAQIQAGGTAIDSDARLAARSILAGARHTLDAMTTLSDWHRAFAELGVALYAVSAETVGAMERKIGRDEMRALLADVGYGARFEDAYRARSGEAVEEFIAEFTRDLALRPSATVGTVADDRGNLPWTLSAFPANSDVLVRISGSGYQLQFTVRTDAIGMYRGTFGSTAIPGRYTLTAQTATTDATAAIDTESR